MTGFVWGISRQNNKISFIFYKFNLEITMMYIIKTAERGKENG